MKQQSKTKGKSKLKQQPPKRKSQPQQQKKNKSLRVEDRRRHDRRGVLDTFHMFLCLKEKGLGKFYLKDISESGFAFEMDSAEGLFMNDIKECRFFINPGLNLLLKFRVAYIFDKGQGHPVKVGAEIVKTDLHVKKVYSTFVQLLDQIAAVSGIYKSKPL